MSFLVCLETGLREIAAHKFRSALSMLGIVMGVSSLIAMMALTAGIEKGTRTFMEQMGGLELVSIQNKEISSAMFEFWMFEEARATVEVFDVNGRLVAKLLDQERLIVGPQALPLELSHLPTGNYFIRLTTPESNLTVGFMK